jgi:hypothetical protein
MPPASVFTPPPPFGLGVRLTTEIAELAVFFINEIEFLPSKNAISYCLSTTSWLSRANSFVFIYLLAFEKMALCFQQPLGFVRNFSNFSLALPFRRCFDRPLFGAISIMSLRNGKVGTGEKAIEIIRRFFS